MNRVVITLLLLIAAVSARADRWEEPGQYEYPDETVLYVQFVDPVTGSPYELPLMGFELAAFIDGDCREDVTEHMRDGSGFMFPCYRLRVRGNMKDDFDKDIRLKLSNQGFVYDFTTTFKFDGESHGTPALPVSLPTLTVMSIEMETPIFVEIGSTIDLSDKAWITYGMSNLRINTVSPIDESLTPVVFNWENNYSMYYDLDPVKKTLTGTQLTEDEYGAHIAVEVMNNYMPLRVDGEVFVMEKIVPVEGISCELTELHTYVFDDVIGQLRPHVTFLPADATNTYFNIEEEKADDREALFMGNTPVNTGETTIRLVSQEDPTLKTDPIKVYILRRPDGIRAKNSTLNVRLGEDVMAALVDNIIFEPTWADDIDKTIDVDYTGPKLFDENYIADHYGQGVIKVRATAQLPDFWTGEVDELTITLIVKTPVTGLTATDNTIYVQTGDNVYDKLKTIVRVDPADATNKDLTFTPRTAGYLDDKGIALKEGQLVVNVASDDAPQYNVDITVVIMGDLFFTLKDVTVSKFGTTDVTLAVSTTIDGKRVQLVPDEHANGNWGPVATVERLDDSGLKWRFHGRYFGSYEYGISYDGSVGKEDANTVARAKLIIPVEYEYERGWNWLSFPVTVKGQTDIAIGEKNTPDFTEVRSIDSETLKDPSLGFFGELTAMNTAGGAYKVKAERAGRLSLGTGELVKATGSATVSPGYNWLVYPHELDHSLAALGGTLAQYAFKGDMIVGRDFFASYDGAEWVAPDLFTFKSGQGYLYYSNTTVEHPILWRSLETAPEEDLPDGKPSVWAVDNRAYADMMPVVATLSGIEQPDDYTVGAFVGDECRGRGFCAVSGLMFITVAGKTGETVSFRLHDERTDEYFDITDRVTFGTRAGSMTTPVLLHPDLTGEGLPGKAAILYDHRQITACGFDGTAVLHLYDAAGRVVATATDGRLWLTDVPQGSYVIRATDGVTTVMKKLVINK